MVFFTCNACGQSVKKAQVEKHYMTQCRNCEVLSCMDCGKDFVGDAYKDHVKCISENEKYGGKNYKAPANKGNKGEAKQEQWLQRVREAKDSAKLSPALSKLMDRIADYPNVPRKKAKFENFLYNSLRVSNKSLVEEAWSLFSEAGVKAYKDLYNEASKPKSDQSEQSNNKSTPDRSSTNNQSQDSKTSQSTDSQSESTEAIDQSHDSKKKKKKKKKDKDADAMATDDAEEEKSNSKRKKRQGDPVVQVSEDDERTYQEGAAAKKHKKKKSKDRTGGSVNVENGDDNAVEQVEESSVPMVNGKGKKKKHKRKLQEDDEMEDAPSSGKRMRGDDEDTSLDDSMVDENGNEDVETSKPKKFKWERVITSVLHNHPDKELPLKKLRKKVLNEYHACGGDVRIKSKEDLRATFDKKVNKNPKLKVHKEVVKLVA